MSAPDPGDPVVRRELPLVLKIIRDEMWLESERRGCCVPAGDPVVRESVCLIILRIGAQMREAITAEMRQGSIAAPPQGREYV